MARYIDADALIEIIKEVLIELETWEPNRKNWYGLTLARRMVNEQPTADVAPRAEWKPVSDPPKKNGRYWVYGVVGGQPLVCVLYFTVRDGFGDDDITHWMPLPEPPQTEGGAE